MLSSRLLTSPARRCLFRESRVVLLATAPTESRERAVPVERPQGLKLASELSKLRLSSMVVMTSGAGFMLAGSPIDVPTLAAATIGTGLCSASAGTFNQVFEKDIDKAMRRTCTRPLPSGKVSVPSATAFGVATGLAGVGLLWAGTNPVVAALGLGNIVLYAGAYTYSKRHTELNTWIGSVVGAIPPLMGWLAATHHLTEPGASSTLTKLAANDPLFFPSLMQYGVFLTGESLMMASLLLLWQFPHFFALSWLYREDYQRGGLQMVSCNDPTGIRTANHIFNYSLLLSAVPIISSTLGYTSQMYLVEGVAANLYLLYLASRFKGNRSNANAKKIFHYSLLYLLILSGGFAFHSRTWNAAVEEKSEMEDAVSDAVVTAKETLKDLCVHEVLSEKSYACVAKQLGKLVNGTKERSEEGLASQEGLSPEREMSSSAITPAESGDAVK